MLHYIIEKSAFLKNEVNCHCHTVYYTMGDPRSTVDFLNQLKNDDSRHGMDRIAAYERQLEATLMPDFAELVNTYGPLTVCGVPRAKSEAKYTPVKMGLKRAIRNVVHNCALMYDGMDYIVRVKDTKTTHLRRSSRFAFGGTGDLPKPGLTHETCVLSPSIAGRNILLVDDIYTPGCGTDEDVIQALFDAGAKSVIFYAVGKAQGNLSGYRRAA